MGDLISRSALLEFAHNHVNGTVDCNDIARFPDVDAEHVRHGQWEDDPYIYKCNICHTWLLIDQGDADMNYCPNCGARMDGGAESCASQN